MWILVDIADVLEVVVWGRVPWEMTTFLLLTPRSPNTKLIREGDFDIKSKQGVLMPQTHTNSFP